VSPDRWTSGSLLAGSLRSNIPLLVYSRYSNFLLVAGAIYLSFHACVFSANLYIGVLLFIAVLITCYETFSQEAKFDSLMVKFRAMVSAQATLRRHWSSTPGSRCPRTAESAPA
jgi:hypothetical protein